MGWNGGHVVLSGYIDDNGDGLEDGNDGGIWAGWDIVNSQNVRDNGGLAMNQHDFDDAIEMPNLSDLTRYEAMALEHGARSRSTASPWSTACSETTRANASTSTWWEPIPNRSSSMARWWCAATCLSPAWSKARA
ncbi:MAG: hypothetical protein R3E96_11260 [Planctomycetota bacterium]